jgi:hypothetical protein
MKTPTKPLKSRILMLCIGVLSAGFSQSGLFAQSTADLPSPGGDDPIQLSPFVVDSESDNGYAATQTLAGTRMRTNLADVGASLTVMTQAFMEDLGVNSFSDALLYTPSVDSTEGDNTDNNRASGTQMRYGTGQSYSIRGFNTNSGEQSISHDFFDALDVTDNYNLERVTLSLGPNALLIGVGNPQGAAVTSTKRALLNKNTSSIRTQIDSNSSARVSFDHNHVLIEDKLAVRFNLLGDKAREFRRYVGKDQKRGTVSLTYKPLKNTTVRVNHESYDVHRNIAPLNYAFDAGILRWEAAGRPTIDFVPTASNWTSTQAYVDHLGNRIPVAAGVVDADGWVDSRTDFDPNLALASNTANNSVWVVGLPGFEGVVNYRYTGSIQTNTFSGSSSNNFQRMNPWEITGIPRDANLNSGTWEDPSSHERGNWTQIILEQKLAENLYLELGHNVANHDRDFTPSWSSNIKMDVNRYLPNGVLNPGYLQPYADSGNMQYREVVGDLTQSRATLSYELDLTERSKWFGSHSFSALYQDTLRDNNEDLLQNYNVAAVANGGNGWAAASTSGNYALNARTYFVNGNVPTIPDPIQVLKNEALLESYGNLIGFSANERQPINIEQYQFLGARNNRSDQKAFSLGWQGRWWDNRLVTVAGYRKDTVDSYITAAPRDVIDPNIPGAATNAALRYYNSGLEQTFLEDPAISSSGITRTYSAVFHATSWVSAFYNESTNFLPVTNATWINALGEPAPDSKGETQDYGLRFNLLDRKLSLSFTKFETSANDQARNANADAGGARNIIDRLRNNYKIGTTAAGPDSHFQSMLDDGQYPIDTGAVSDTWSYVAEGYEMTVVFNPNRNWRISLSGSKNSNTLGTHLAALGEYMYNRDTQFEGLGTWRDYAAELRKVEGGQASSSFALNPTIEAHRIQAGVDALYIETQANNFELNYLDDIALTGVTTARNGKYAANGLVTYTFDRESRLKGWSVGGNYRYRSANTIGYERDLTGATGLIPNTVLVEQPLLGDDWYDVGMMLSYQRKLSEDINLKLQLNVMNLFNLQEARVVSADYDTRAVYGTTNAIVPTRWEIRPPRSFVLTSTLEF